MVWSLITNFCSNFQNSIKGKYDTKTSHAKISSELSGGAKIKLMYQDLFSEFLDKRATEHMSDDHINKAIVLHQGDSIPGFPSVDSFLFLITPLLKRMRDPSLELLNNVHLYLESISSQLIDKIFARFPTIIDDINDITNKALKEEKELSKELIENVIESERTYIFTNDLEYMTQRTSFIPQPTNPQPVSHDPRNPQSQQQPAPIDPEKLFIDEMRTRIDAYFAIVLRNIRDTIPKLIGNFLVRSIQEKLQYTLYNEINKNETIMDLVGEPPHIVAERETLNKVLGVLRKARLVLTKDPDLAPTFKDAAPAPVKQTVPKTISDSRPTTSSTQSSEPSFRPNPNQGQSQNPNTFQPGPSNPKTDMYGGGAPMNKPVQPVSGSGTGGAQQVFGGKPAEQKPQPTDLFGRGGGQPPSNQNQNQPSGGSGTNNPFAPKKGLFG